MKILTFATIIILALFFAYPEIDLAVSKIFYTEGVGFTHKHAWYSMIFYYGVKASCIGILAVCLGVILNDYVVQKYVNISFIKTIGAFFRPFFKITKQQAMFVFLVIVITPGILVHWVMKPTWDRARPVNIEQFGGVNKFTPFYKMFAGQDGNSFPSGHASMASSLIALSYVVAQNRRKKVLIATSIFAVLASACRVWQGGHYLTDVTLGLILTLWTILLVKKFYLDKASLK